MMEIHFYWCESILEIKCGCPDSQVPAGSLLDSFLDYNAKSKS